jgi:hypothetical protein
MKAVPLFSVLALWLIVVLGCGPVPGDPRLEVNDTLRQACSGAGASDTYIQTLINIAETDRNAGRTADEARTELWASCGLDPACATCSAAIVGQVYE